MKVKFIALVAILACLLIVIPAGFAADNGTVIGVNANNHGIGESDIHDGPLEDVHYYFNASVENDDGNGSKDTPYKELKGNRIQDNSIIHLADGVYNLNENKYLNNVTVLGQNVEKTIVVSSGGYNIYTTNSLVLQNITFINLRIQDNSNAEINITNVIFKDTKSSVIFADSASTKINIDNCTFINNTAVNGGAVQIQANADVLIKKSNFINDYSSKDAGGAFYIKDCLNFILQDSIIENCTATLGGGITALDSNLTLINVTARNNRAKYDGGVIYAMYSSLMIHNSSFDNNSARNAGVVFADEINPFNVFNNSFTNNRATNTGGAIYSLLSVIVNGSVYNETLKNLFLNNSAMFENDAYETDNVSLTIGNNDYILFVYNSSFNGTIPVKYDLRDENGTTPVKSQGSNGNCWAFSSLAALESCIRKATGTVYDLSESNMKNLMATYSDYGWDMPTNKGGYDKMSYAYLVSWLGPVNESDDEYRVNTVLSPVMDSIFHIQNILFLNRKNYTDNDAIKKAIMEYGAVSSSIMWKGTVKGNARYYNGEVGANHAVTIVGWDDNYSRNNFAVTPPGDGAWIVKNSHGTGSGQNGYWYVSYYDVSLALIGKADSTFTFIFNDTIKYDKNYQYDISGKTDYLLNSTKTVWYKNIFTATDNEYLSAVSTYFLTETDWEISIYVNDVLKHVQSGKALNSYSTIELSQFVPLNIGDVFEVVFRIAVDGDVAVPISEKVIAAGVNINKEVHTENKSFISNDGENWIALYNLTWAYSGHSYESQVACIKAFTILDEINTTVKLSFDENDTIIKAIVMNQYNRPIINRNITFTLDGEDYIVAIVNGVAILDIPLNTGKHNVSAVFSSVGFISSQDNITFENKFLNTSLSIEFEYSEPINIIAKVFNQYGSAVRYGNVTFKINGSSYTVNLSRGIASIEYPFNKSGSYDISVVFNPPVNYYNASSIEEAYYLPIINTTVTLVIDDYNPVNITANVLNQYGYKVNCGTVTFVVDGVQYDVDVVDGRATLIKEFPAHVTHNVSATFNPIEYYNSSYDFKEFDISLIKTRFDSWVCTPYNPIVISVSVVDLNGNSINYGYVTFTVEGNQYNVSVINGTANLTHVFKKYGSNIIDAVYNGLDYYASSDITINLKVNTSIVSNDADKTFNSLYEIKFLDYDESPLNNAEITLKINSDIYKIKTDENGVAKFNIDLNPGKYELEITNPVTHEIKTQIINVVARISDNHGLSMYYGAGKSYSVKVLDDDGNIAKAVTVTFTINNKKYTVNTDSKGYASFKISQKPGKYVITAEYKGFKVSDDIVVKSTIITKNINVKKGKTIKFTVKLLNKNGQALKNKKIKFIFKGKKYKAKTNKKGKATLKIANKFKVGKYTIISSYGGLKVKNTIKIK